MSTLQKPQAAEFTSIHALLRKLGPESSEPACRYVDPELFFPPARTEDSGRHAAKRVCAICSVRVKCLNEAIKQGEVFGIWGGTTPAERRFLQSQTQRLVELDRDHIRSVLAGLRPINVRAQDRPAVVHLMLSRGWSVDRIASTLKLPCEVIDSAASTARKVIAFATATGVRLPAWAA